MLHVTRVTQSPIKNGGALNGHSLFPIITVTCTHTSNPSVDIYSNLPEDI